MLDRLVDRTFRNLVEYDSLHILVVEEVAIFQHLIDMPGDGFALAVGVCREIDRRCVLDGLCDAIDMLLVLVDQLVFHGEAMLGIDGAFLRDQIPHVTIRGQDLEALTEIFFYRPRFGRGLDDDKVLAHGDARRLLGAGG